MKNLGQTLNSLGFELFWVLQKSLLYQDFVDFEALSDVARGMIGTVGTLSEKKKKKLKLNIIDCH